MIKRNILVTGAAMLAAIGSMATFALAQTPPPDPGKQVKLHVEVNDNGRVVVRGAKVTSVVASTINATLTWEGGANIPWVINTDGNTEFRSSGGVQGLLSDLAVGHTISFEGRLVPASTLTVRADKVRNLSIEKQRVNPFGVIQSIDAGAKKFMLRTDNDKFGDVTVQVSAATEIVKGKATTTFASLTVGDRARVAGIWDKTTNTIQAEKIEVHEKQRVNPFGVIQSIDAGAKKFMLRTDNDKFGDVTVQVSAATEIVKGKATTTFAALKVGDKVHAGGLWDSVAKTIQAERIKIFVENRRTFEGGKLKSVSTAIPPTSIVVEFGKFDYTVNIGVDSAVINKNWGPAKLSDFKVGDNIRVYGVADGLNIEATVVRNMSLPR